MDNEALVDQMVRSLSFEVVAIPQDIARKNTISKATPLNVKVKVRKKTDTGLHHGVLSMPKVDQKDNKIPKRIRLVSSDQTIMSFNVEMEADFDKVSPTAGRGKDQHTLSAKTDKYNSTPIVFKKNKDIFGRCKPGGCLDPPFGEDKYAYKPTFLKAPVTDTETLDSSIKLRSSSIFKNKIFNRKRKSTTIDDVNKCYTKNDVDSVLSLYENGSKSSTNDYDSLITYPHPSSSSELRLQEDRSNKKRHASENKSKISVVENSSYFIKSKKTKNLITNSNENQTECKDVPTDTSAETKNTNESHTFLPPDYDKINPVQFREDKSSSLSIIPNVIPIPIPIFNSSHDDKNVTLDIPNGISQEENKSKKNETESLDQSKIDDGFPDSDNKMNKGEEKQDIVKTKCSTFPDNLSENNTNYDVDASLNLKMMNQPRSPSYTSSTFEKTGAKNYIEESVFKSQSNVGMASDLLPSEPTVLHKIQDVDDDLSDINQARSSTHQNVIPIVDVDVIKIMDENINVIDHTDDLESCVSANNDSKTELFSQPLIPEARDKSLLDVTAEFPLPETESIVENEQKISKTEQSIGELTQIWQNRIEGLKSVADNIVRNKLSPEKNDKDITNAFVGEQNRSNILKEIVDDLKSLADIESVKSSSHTSDNKEDRLGKAKLHENILNQMDKDHDENMNKKDKENALLVKSIDNIGLTYTKNAGELSEKKSKHSKADTHTSDSKEEREGKPKSHKNILNRMDKDHDENMNNKDKKDALLVNSIDDIRLTHTKHIRELYEKNIEHSQADTHTSDRKEERVGKVKSHENILNRMDKDHDENMNNKDKEDALLVNSIDDILLTHTKHSGELYEKASKLSQAETNDIDMNTQSSENSSIIDLVRPGDYTAHYTGSNFKEQITDQTHSDLSRSEEEANRAIEITPNVITEHKDMEDGVKPSFSIEKNPIEDVLQVVRPLSAPFQNGVNSWKMDLALQSYVDENNEKVIKSYDSVNVIKRRPTDILLVAQCTLKTETTEIKIPVDNDNSLQIKIIGNRWKNKQMTDTNEIYTQTEEYLTSKKIKRNATASEMKKSDNEDDIISPSQSKEHKIDSKIRDALSTIYENELVPLQETIKGLRDEIDMLAAHEIKFRERAHNTTTKRSRPMRLIPNNKKCSCVRRV